MCVDAAGPADYRMLEVAQATEPDRAKACGVSPVGWSTRWCADRLRSLRLGARAVQDLGSAVHVHYDELPLASGEIIPAYPNPLDRWLIGSLLRLMPRRRVEVMVSKNSLDHAAHRVSGPPHISTRARSRDTGQLRRC